MSTLDIICPYCKGNVIVYEFAYIWGKGGQRWRVPNVCEWCIAGHYIVHEGRNKKRVIVSKERDVC